MATTENGDSDARADVSLHPLWEEYLFPTPPPPVATPQKLSKNGRNGEKFWYNPYTGALTLDFPKASKRCGSGILADEMGLGKTIMSTFLIFPRRLCG